MSMIKNILRKMKK